MLIKTNKKIHCRAFIHSFIHGAEAFLRSRQLCSYSRTSQHFMEPEGSYRVYNIPLLIPILTQINPIHTIQSYLSNILLTFQVPNLIFIFFRLGRLSKVSVKVRGFLWSFVTSLFLRWEVVKPTPNTQAGGPPLVGCPRLCVQYVSMYSSIEDSGVVLVFERNNAGLKIPSSFVWTDKWLICLPKCHLSFKVQILVCIIIYCLSGTSFEGTSYLD
jgi:hypothetical protein